jgi:hypothetical protein
MSRPILNSLASRALRTIDRLSPPATIEAHCDIPCGIYDPHLLQIGALTIVRMNQLIDALGDDAAKTKASLSRYKARQEINMQAAEDLLAQAQKFAEIFWDTKGVKSKRQPSNQAVGGEIVVPA